MKRTCGWDDSSERLNLREEPSTSADVLDKIPDGEEVEVLEEGEWAKIEYDGKTGYVLNEYLVYEFEPDLSQETVQEVTARVVLSSGTLNLREEASEDSERLEGIENGEDVDGAWHARRMEPRALWKARRLCAQQLLAAGRKRRAKRRDGYGKAVFGEFEPARGRKRRGRRSGQNPKWRDGGSARHTGAIGRAGAMES